MTSTYEKFEDGTVIETKTVTKEYATASIDAEIEQIDKIMTNYQLQKDDLLAKRATIRALTVKLKK